MVFTRRGSFKAVGRLLTPRGKKQGLSCSSSSQNLKDLRIDDLSTDTVYSSFMDVSSHDDSSNSLNFDSAKQKDQLPSYGHDLDGSCPNLNLEEKPRSSLTRSNSLKRLGDFFNPKMQGSYFRSKSISNLNSIILCDGLSDTSDLEDDENDLLSNVSSEEAKQNKLDASLKIQNAIMEVEDRNEELEDLITKNLELAKYRFQQMDKTSSSLANKIVATNAMCRVLESETEHFRMGVILESLLELEAQIKDKPNLTRKINPKIDKILALKETIQEEKHDISLLSSEDLLLELERRL